MSIIWELIGTRQIDLLKMDIEGSEYEVLDQMLLDQIFPKQICVKFQNRIFRDGQKRFDQIKLKFEGYGYQIKGISQTNEEYLFVCNI